VIAVSWAAFNFTNLYHTGTPMKRYLALATWGIALTVGLACLSGCGGSSNSTPPPPAASITSFTTSSATITAGQSTTLTGVFVNGTGVITPGNIAAVSGTAVTVTPTATTTYTLTVTPSSGAAVTATVSITVNPAPPTITSFVASPATITAGQSATLTGVFANGTGVITPGNISATSGTAVTVSPTATTIYTLTVTPSSGSAITATATVTVNPATTSISVNPGSPGIPVTSQLLGMNLAEWYDWPDNASSIISAFNATGIKAIRWPGGSWSDDFHWGYQPGSSALVTQYECQTASPVTGGWGGYSTFANFVNTIPLAGPYDLALTANYGTDEACTGGGDPNEAAAWAAAAVADGIVPSHMTVGNEEYGTWETDLHANAHDPATYAGAVTGSTGYYAQIKAASPHTLVGVVADAQSNCCVSDWDSTVLGNAAGSYDFVEYHFYPENPGGESDSYLVNSAPQVFTQSINLLKSELQTAGKPNTPIYVGEMGSVSSNPGKQSWSITQGLFAGQLLGEMMNDGISRATWWIGFGNCNGSAGNDSTSLYGWQDFGAYNVFSDGPSDTTCPGAGPIGTMSPTAVAFQLFSNVAITGQSVLAPTVTGDTTDVRAYAATNPGGTALVLFNVNETTPQQVVVTLTGKTSSGSVNVTTYDKALYDLSGSTTGTPADPSGTSTWAAPTTTNMGAQTLPLTLTLTPWSMNVLIIQ